MLTEELELADFLRHRRRLLLGLFIADPSRDERRLRVALNAGAATLACELGRREVLVETGQGVRETLGKPSEGGWRRCLALWGTVAFPFFAPFREEGAKTGTGGLSGQRRRQP